MTQNRQPKKGEQVKVISGKYKNQTGTIIKVIHKKQQVIIENINIKTKHSRPKREEEKGEILKIEAPIHQSNITMDT